MRSVVITGVSSGIGYATAKELVRRDFRVFGTVRNKHDASRVAATLGAGFEPLLVDVTDAKAVTDAVARVEREVGDYGLTGLVNNAGINITGPLLHLRVDDLSRVLDVNVLGVMRMSQAFLPLLGAGRERPPRPGRIVNVGSYSCEVANPFTGAYAAGSHALLALTHVLRRELLIYGIDVVLLELGMVETPAWDVLPDASAYDDTDYETSFRRTLDVAFTMRPGSLHPEKVSAVIHKALTTRRPRTRYVMMDKGLRRSWRFRNLPDRWLDRAISRNLEIRRLD